jgi:hypothetical protein
VHDDARHRPPELPMPGRRRKASRPLLAVIVIAACTLAAVAALRLLPRGGAAPAPAPAACPAAAPEAVPEAVPAAPPGPPGAAYRLLPVTAGQLGRAAAVAAAFTSAYGTYSYAQPAAAYLARLRPYTAPELQAELARAAATPGLLEQRDRQRASATTTATATGIRDIAGTTVTVIVTARQVTRPPAAGSTSVQQYAVTVIPAGTGWQAWDIQPADAGQAGSEP